MVFAIPTNSIDHTKRLPPLNNTGGSGKPLGTSAGEVVDAVPLADALSLPRSEHTSEGSSVLIVLRYSGTSVGLLVDAVQMEAEVPVRPLGKTLPYVRNIAAATVLEDGQIIPVIHVADTSAAALRLIAASTPATGHGPRRAGGNRSGSILIVEDSITSRLLVKSVLELAGYTTRTAVDGVDALLALNSGTFDLVISDVDMPRMSGLELTRRIRSDNRTASLPVILMTALATLQDRERGLQAGANDYIIKSSVHHGDILASITRILAPK